MSTNKRRPYVMDPRHPGAAGAAPPVTGSPKAVQDYKEAVAARAAQQRATRDPMPNIAMAQELFKPGKDRPMSIGAIGEAQRRLEGDAEPGLSPQTVAGLSALHGAMKEQRSKMDEEQGNNLPAMPMMAAPTPPAPESSPAGGDKPKTADNDEGRKTKLRDTLSEMDDLEFDRVLKSVQQDAINNDKERRAVKERCKPIDLLRGISTGEFVQDVPVIPNVLVVRYRTISALENQSIRLMLFKMIDQDKRRENIAAEIYGLMQAVCSVVMINNQAVPPHLKGEGYKSQFDEEGFTLKFEQFIRYPLVMLHAIGTHGYWFEQRVRESFTTDTIKNG